MLFVQFSSFIETGYLTLNVEYMNVTLSAMDFNAIPCTLTTLTINGATISFSIDLEPY